MVATGVSTVAIASGTSALAAACSSRAAATPPNSWGEFMVGLRLLLSLGHDSFEILARHHERVSAAAVHQFEQLDDVGFQCSLFRGVERREGAVDRAVVGSEDLQPMAWRLVAKVEGLLRGGDVVTGKQLHEARHGAPQRG